jgi:hypothetical protein
MTVVSETPTVRKRQTTTQQPLSTRIVQVHIPVGKSQKHYFDKLSVGVREVSRNLHQQEMLSCWYAICTPQNILNGGKRFKEL